MRWEVMMSKDWATAFQFAHQANIERYRKLLRTHLTDTERAFVERRLNEEQRALHQLLETAASTRTAFDAA
jgi:hypothetical protein